MKYALKQADSLVSFWTCTSEISYESCSSYESHSRILREYSQNGCESIQGKFYFSYYQIIKYLRVKDFLSLLSYIENRNFQKKRWEVATEEKGGKKSRCKLYNQTAAEFREDSSNKKPSKKMRTKFPWKMLWLIQSTYVGKYLRLV